MTTETSTFTGLSGIQFNASMVKIDVERVANIFKRVLIEGDYMTVITTKFIKPNKQVQGELTVTVRVYNKNSGKSVSKRAASGVTTYGIDNLVKNVLITSWGSNEGKVIGIKQAHAAKKDHSFAYGLAVKSNGKNGVNELLLPEAKTFISDMVALNPKTVKAKEENKPLTDDELAAQEAAQLAEIEAATN